MNQELRKIPTIFTQLNGLAVDVLFPKKCVECQKPGQFVCFDCISKISKVMTPICQKCGKITQSGQYCSSCRSSVELTGVMVACDYSAGPTKEMIHHLKYSGFVELSEALAELLVEKIKQSKKIKFVVVPVPMDQKKEIERGFNQSELMARYISKKLGLKGGLALEKTKRTPAQMKLKRTERLKNLAGVFECVDRGLVKGKNILLVDDVMTTGTTLNECAKELRKAGARQVWGAVVARG